LTFVTLLPLLLLLLVAVTVTDLVKKDGWTRRVSPAFIVQSLFIPDAAIKIKSRTTERNVPKPWH
jgi:hypothetical protein